MCDGSGDGYGDDNGTDDAGSGVDGVHGDDGCSDDASDDSGDDDDGDDGGDDDDEHHHHHHCCSDGCLELNEQRSHPMSNPEKAFCRTSQATLV